jgi:hypothetical protein
MSTEVHLKFLPSYGISNSMRHGEGIPLVGCGTFESSQSVQDLLSVIALGDVQFLRNDLKPVIGIQGVYCMRESRRVMAHEIPMLISSLGCMFLLMLVLLVLLVLVNLLHRHSESLQKLYLCCDELIHIGIGWRWWQLLTSWFWWLLGPERVFTIWLVRKCNSGVSEE